MKKWRASGPNYTGVLQHAVHMSLRSFLKGLGVTGAALSAGSLLTTAAKASKRSDIIKQDEREHRAGFESMEVGHESSPQS